MARRSNLYTPRQVFYAAACAYAESTGAQPGFIELFREDVADPEAVDTLGDRDPGFRIALADLVDDPVTYVGLLAASAGCRQVWAQVLDQVPAPPAVLIPLRGTIE